MVPIKRLLNPLMLVISLLLISLGLAGAFAQDYPTKPIRLVTVPIGGSSDRMARLTAEGLSGPLGQQVIVDNRGGGVIPAETVAKSPPDGYTLLVQNNSVWTTPFFQKLTFDPVTDFAPISLLISSPQLLVVHPSLPVTSVKELIALAKTRPGDLNYASSTNGTSSHLAGEAFNGMAGVKIVRITYGSNTNDIADLVSGQVQMTFQSPTSVTPQIKAGRLRVLGVTSLKPSPLFPDLPTVATTLPGFVSQSIWGIWAPAKTPDAVVKRLSQEIMRYFNSPEIKKRLLSFELEGVDSTPEEFVAYIKADVARLEKMAKEGRLK